jgi:electron transfer flavoprotein alpha subunit
MILLVTDHAHGVAKRSTFELVTVGRDLAQAAGTSLAALVVGVDPTAIADELAHHVDHVIVVRDPRLEPLRAETLTRAVTHVAQSIGATTVLLPGSRAALSYGPRVALRLGGGFVDGATGVRVEGERLVVTRPTHLARFEASVVVGSSVTVISLSPGAALASAPTSGRGRVEEIDVPFETQDTRLRVDAGTKVRGPRRIALEEAEIVVCGGRGLGSAEDFESHVQALADQLEAAVGVTRAVVDAGWRTLDDLVGQTGKAVAPKLCFALGVSGAVHFVSGVTRARVLVAVNTDAEAPIFRSADYGIVGDVREVAPALLEALAAPS